MDPKIECRMNHYGAQNVAKTILEQISGLTLAELAVKSTHVLEIGCGGVELRLVGAPETRGKRVRIVLTSEDLYSISVVRVRGLQEKEIASTSGVQAENLDETIRSLVFRNTTQENV